MIVNPTNEAFLRAAQRQTKAAKRKKVPRYNVAVVPTVAGYSARVIDCTSEDPHRLEIVRSYNAVEIEDAIESALGSIDLIVEPYVFKIEGSSDGFAWVAYSAEGDPLEDKHVDTFVRI